MRVISKARLRAFWEESPDAESALTAWYAIARKAKWTSIAEVRRTYPHADAVTIVCSKSPRVVRVATVFNVRGNNVRLITRIVYETQCVYIKFVLTHAEYDRELWKEQICRE